MADEAGHERKHRKKKHKKKHKRVVEEVVSPDQDIEDVQQSEKEHSTPEPKRERNGNASKTATQQNLAAKSNISKPVEWSHAESKRLLKEILKSASDSNGKELVCFRVDWSKVKLDEYSEVDMQEEYRRLTKRVRKTRTIGEIVNDALRQHEENKGKPQSGKSNSQKPKQGGPKPPPRPQNAFVLFCKAKRPSLVEKYPGLTFAEVHKKMCERWREMPENKREKYHLRYEKAKKQYQEQLQEFQKKQLEGIKKPSSAFDMWKMQRLEEKVRDEDDSDSDLLLEWENMPKSMKKGWFQAAAYEQDRYNSEVKSITKGQAMSLTKGKPVEKDSAMSNKKDKIRTEKSKNRSIPEVLDDGHQSQPPRISSAQKRKIDSAHKLQGFPTMKVPKRSESSSEDDDSDDSSEDE